MVREIGEAALGQAHPERELAAFEQGPAVLAAGTRSFALGAAATGLAQSAAQSAADAATALTAGIGGEDVLEAHSSTPLSIMYCSRVRSRDSASSVARMRFTGLWLP